MDWIVDLIFSPLVPVKFFPKVNLDTASFFLHRQDERGDSYCLTITWRISVSRNDSMTMTFSVQKSDDLFHQTNQDNRWIVKSRFWDDTVVFVLPLIKRVFTWELIQSQNSHKSWRHAHPLRWYQDNLEKLEVFQNWHYSLFLLARSFLGVAPTVWLIRSRWDKTTTLFAWREKIDLGPPLSRQRATHTQYSPLGSFVKRKRKTQ